MLKRLLNKLGVTVWTSGSGKDKRWALVKTAMNYRIEYQAGFS
jgi:hypothetical protein